MSKEIEELKAIVADAQKRIEKLELSAESKFEVGKWYKHKEGIDAAFCQYAGHGYGFGLHCVVWSHKFMMSDISLWRLATQSETESALIAEAKRRGFKEGVRFDNQKLYEHTVGVKKVKDGKIRFISNCIDLEGTDGFYHTIYRDGKWAEVVKEEKIMIGGHEVIRHDKDFKIGCKVIYRGYVETARALLADNGFNSLSIDGLEITLPTIEKMLKL